MLPPPEHVLPAVWHDGSGAGVPFPPLQRVPKGSPRVHRKFAARLSGQAAAPGCGQLRTFRKVGHI